jgi:hypothetical protein
MMTPGRILTTTSAVVLAAIVVLLNVRLYTKPDKAVYGADTINMNQLKHLRYLSRIQRDGAALQMQSMYPEGFVFFNSLYGLAWAEFSHSVTPSSPLWNEAYSEVSVALSEVQSNSGKMTFEKDLPLPYGAFFNGWSGYLMASRLLMDTKKDSADIVTFREQCDQIAAAVQLCVYPESYAEQAWPADVVMCMATLSLHDKMFTPQYQGVIMGWVQAVKGSLDEYGLIPHKVRPCSGETIESARGSSQALMLSMLPHIDDGLAMDQYAGFRQNFMDTRLGLFGIREYPLSTSGNGDIDSGPVVLQMGAAATIVGIRAAAMNNDHLLAHRLSQGIEAFAAATTSSHEKRYLFGTLPVADAFLAWAHSSTPLYPNPPLWIPVRFHTISLLVIAAPFLLMLLRRLTPLRPLTPSEKQREE